MYPNGFFAPIYSPFNSNPFPIHHSVQTTQTPCISRSATQTNLDLSSTTSPSSFEQKTYLPYIPPSNLPYSCNRMALPGQGNPFLHHTIVPFSPYLLREQIILPNGLYLDPQRPITIPRWMPHMEIAGVQVNPHQRPLPYQPWAFGNVTPLVSNQCIPTFVPQATQHIPCWYGPLSLACESPQTIFSLDVYYPRQPYYTDNSSSPLTHAPRPWSCSPQCGDYERRNDLHPYSNSTQTQTSTQTQETLLNTTPKPNHEEGNIPPPKLSGTEGISPSDKVLHEVLDSFEWLNRTLKIITIDDLIKSRKWKKAIPLPPGFIFAPALTYNVHDPTTFQNEPLRNWIDLNKQRWANIGLLLEIGSGINGTVPTGLLNTKLGLGFDGFLQVDVLKPIQFGWAEAKNTLNDLNLILPFRAKDAIHTQQGVEVTLRGKGALRGKLGIGLGPAISLHNAHAQADLGIEASSAVTGDFSIHVKKLEENQVQLTLGHAHQFSTQASIAVQSAIKTSKVKNFGSSFQNGILKKLCTSRGINSLKDLVTKYSQASASASGGVRFHDKTIATFAFDLNHPIGRKAYDHAIKLDFTLAEKCAELSKKDPSSYPGVRWAKLEESGRALYREAELSAFGEKLLLSNVLDKIRRGEFTTHDGEEIAYYIRGFEKNHFGILRGSQQLEWNVVMTKEKDGQFKPNLEIDFTKKDKRTFPHEANVVFNLATALGDEHAEDQRIAAELATEKLKNLSFFKRMDKKDDTTVRANVYITAPGIERISKASSYDAMTAYLEAYSLLHEPLPFVYKDKRTSKQAFAIAEQYLKHKKIKWTQHQTVDRQHLHDEWRRLFGTRALKKDADILKKALKFSASMGDVRNALEIQNESKRARKIAKIFHQLGRQYGFSFIPSLAAISRLAGEDATIIRQLSITGKELKFQSSEEGFEDPLEAIRREIDHNKIGL